MDEILFLLHWATSCIVSSSRSLIEMMKISRGQADSEFLNSTDWYSSWSRSAPPPPPALRKSAVNQPTGCHSVQKDSTRDSNLSYININTSPMGKKQMRVGCQGKKKKILLVCIPQRGCHTSCLKKPSLPLPKSPWGHVLLFLWFSALPIPHCNCLCICLITNFKSFIFIIPSTQPTAEHVGGPQIGKR